MKKNKSVTSKTLPAVPFDIDTHRDYSFLIQEPDIKKYTFDRATDAIFLGIAQKKKVVNLFKIPGKNETIVQERPSWKETLENALQFYAGIEDYNKCIECREMIKSL